MNILVGVNFSGVKLLFGEKYRSPLKNWSLFTGDFFTDKAYMQLTSMNVWYSM